MEFFSHPAFWAVVGVAAITGLFKLAMWIGEVNEHKRGVASILKEMRADIKNILHRLPPAAAGSGESAPDASATS